MGERVGRWNDSENRRQGETILLPLPQHQGKKQDYLHRCSASKPIQGGGGPRGKDKVAAQRTEHDKHEIDQIYKKEISNILVGNRVNIRSFLSNDIDYDINSINITLHIRRGDIMYKNMYLDVHKSRYLPNDYYLKALHDVINIIIYIYIYIYIW